MGVGGGGLSFACGMQFVSELPLSPKGKKGGRECIMYLLITNGQAMGTSTAEDKLLFPGYPRATFSRLGLVP